MPSPSIKFVFISILLLLACLLLYYTQPAPYRALAKPQTAPLVLHSAKLVDRYELLIQKLISTSTHRERPSHSHSILILQHAADLSPLHIASIATHRAYAAIQQYGFKTDSQDYIPNPQYKQEKSNNKLYTLRNALREEIDSGKAEWIFFTDVDTFIYDPLVPLHYLLPPTSLSPTPYILGNQDHNGFNAGVMLFRVNTEVLTWIDTIITLYQAMTGERHGVVSDQMLLQQALINHPAMAAHFYEIPKGWANAYWPGEHWEGVQLQVHLVNHLKDTQSWLAILEQTVVNAEARMTGTGNMTRVDEATVEKITKSSAKKWWDEAHGGIDNMKLLWAY